MINPQSQSSPIGPVLDLYREMDLYRKPSNSNQILGAKFVNEFLQYINGPPSSVTSLI